MPVIRISDEQKDFLDSEIDRRFEEEVSYRVIIGEIISDINDD